MIPGQLFYMYEVVDGEPVPNNNSPCKKSFQSPHSKKSTPRPSRSPSPQLTSSTTTTTTTSSLEQIDSSQLSSAIAPFEPLQKIPENKSVPFSASSMTVIEAGSPTDFTELVVRPYMMYHHYPIVYENAFYNATLSLSLGHFQLYAKSGSDQPNNGTRSE
jgi:hypothetical protein